MASNACTLRLQASLMRAVLTCIGRLLPAIITDGADNVSRRTDLRVQSNRI